MKDIVWRRRTNQRRRPATLVMALSGWTDAGDAVTLAYQELANVLALQDLAFLDPEHFYDFSMVRPMVTIDHRGISELRWTTLVLSESQLRRRNANFVLFGPEPQFRWKTATAELIELAHLLKVERLVTIGSLLAPTPHTRPPRLFGYASTAQLAERLELESPHYDGPTGFLSVVQAAAANTGIEVVSLWVEVPHYLSQFPAQRPALALLDRLERLLGLDDEFTELASELDTTDREVQDYVARDPDLVAYVSSLEHSWEQEQSVRSSMHTIAQEAERYLRRQAHND